MNEFQAIKLDKKAKTPLYQQLGEGLCRLIEAGILKKNTKLPPIRKMADALGLNAVTVVSAYKYLEQKKVVYSQVGSGTYVSPIPLSVLPLPVAERHEVNLKILPELEKAINFASTALPEALFPVREFKTAFDILLEAEKGGAFRHVDSQGYAPLRECFCQYLLDYGIKASPENIQVISGAQQGIDIVAKAVLGYGDVIFIEKPTFSGAAGAFLSRGAKLLELPLLPDGIDLEHLENLICLYRPKLLYMMAYFQTPTGYSYSMEKKRRLLDLAEQYDFYIMEDDNLYDFNYTGKTLVPLKALDYKNRVIYIKSFSKVLMPGLRMGFALLPKKIMRAAAEAKYTTDIATSGFLQKALAYYFQKEDWKRHIEEMARYGLEKYRVMCRAVDKYLLPYVSYQKPEGGISLWLTLCDGISVDRMMNKLLERGIIVGPGAQYFMTPEESGQIRLCFANLSDDKILVGIVRMREVIENMLK